MSNHPFDSAHLPFSRRSLAGSAAKPNKKVLVVEDDEAFRRFLVQMLTGEGYEVVAVADGVQGLQQVLAGEFYAVLSDMMMPTLPGDMFYQAVERMRPHVCRRFIFMTGQFETARVKQFFAMTGGMVLLKPFRIEELREMLAFVGLRNLHLAN